MLLNLKYWQRNLNIREEKDGMKISQNGINLIKQFEGCRLTAYKCAAGVWTIGYGHTAGVKAGQRITQVQAESYLKNDLAKYEKLVEKYDCRYHWNQNQFDALVSFAFNVGSIDQLTAGGSRDIKTISQKMPQYNKAAGKTLSGLTKRRMAEQELFLKKEAQNMQAASAEPVHIQLNYKPGKKYKTAVDGLRIRTKRAAQPVTAIPSGGILGILKKGVKVKNHATARVGDQIWMYIGLDKQGREQWACADTGEKAYIR